MIEEALEESKPQVSFILLSDCELPTILFRRQKEGKRTTAKTDRVVLDSKSISTKEREVIFSECQTVREKKRCIPAAAAAAEAVGELTF